MALSKTSRALTLKALGASDQLPKEVMANAAKMPGFAEAAKKSGKKK